MLFIVTPAFNEEQNLGLLIPKIIQILYDNKIPYKIIVVNDGSQDGTKKVAESFAKKLPLQVVNHEVNNCDRYSALILLELQMLLITASQLSAVKESAPCSLRITILCTIKYLIWTMSTILRAFSNLNL